MTKNSKLLLGIMGAFTTGIALGLLIAPVKGKEARKKVKDSAGKIAENLNHLFEKGKEKFSKSDLKPKVEKMNESLS